MLQEDRPEAPSMHDPRPRRHPYAAEAANPPATVPDAQRRALERRNALNEQHRNLPATNGVPSPHFPHRRPPG
jgi:hypothetical protein